MSYIIRQAALYVLLILGIFGAGYKVGNASIKMWYVHVEDRGQTIFIGPMTKKKCSAVLRTVEAQVKQGLWDKTNGCVLRTVRR